MALGFLARLEDGGPFDLRFTHAMLREVPLQSLLRDQRRKVHLRIAQAFEARVPDARERWAEWLLAHYEAAEAWDRAEELAGALAIRARGAAGEVPEAVARRVADAARGSDERHSVVEVLFAVGSVVSNWATALGSALLFGLAIGDPWAWGPYVGVLLLSSVAGVWYLWPWTRVRAVVVDDRAVRIRRVAGAPIEIPLDALRELRWHTHPGVLDFVRLSLRRTYAGRPGSASDAIRAFMLQRGFWIELVHDGGRVLLATANHRPVVLALIDALALRARSGTRPVAFGGSAGPFERQRRVWWTPSDPAERASVPFGDLVAGIERGEIAPTARVAIGDPAALELLEDAARRDPALARALSPFGLLRRPHVLVAMFALFGLLVGAFPMILWRSVYSGGVVVALALSLAMASTAASAVVLTALLEWSRRLGMSAVGRRAASGSALVLGVAILGLSSLVGGLVTGFASSDLDLAGWAVAPPAARLPLAAIGSAGPAGDEALGELRARYGGVPAQWYVEAIGILAGVEHGDWSRVTDRAVAARQEFPDSTAFAFAGAASACRTERWAAALPFLDALLLEPTWELDDLIEREALEWLDRTALRGAWACLARARAETGTLGAADAIDRYLAMDGPVVKGALENVVRAWLVVYPDDPDGLVARLPGHETQVRSVVRKVSTSAPDP